MSKYRFLKAGEIIKEGDESDVCRDGWRDPPIWKTVPKHTVGKPASDPAYPSHAIIRRKALQEQEDE